MSTNNVLNVDISHPTDRPNFTELHLPDITLWFSYKTLIAFRTPETGLVLSENLWGTTTGKHLNHLGDKADRLSRRAFEVLAGRILVQVSLEPVTGEVPGSGREPMLGGDRRAAA
jgi:hypothetical protein